MAKTPNVDAWMPLWIGDFLAETTHLNDGAVGSYMLMLMWYWRRGPLPDDDEQLAQIARCAPDAWSKRRALLAPFFTIESGQWIHRRAGAERAAAEHKAQVNQKRATAGAKGRWGKRGDDENDASSNAPRKRQAVRKQCPSPSPSTPPTDVGGDATTKRGTRLQPGWKPPREVIDKMRLERPDVNLRLEHDKFHDHFKAAPGRHGVKLDWEGTWRNWIRNAKGDPTRATSQQGRSASERVAAANQRAERDDFGTIEGSFERIDHPAPVADDG